MSVIWDWISTHVFPPSRPHRAQKTKKGWTYLLDRLGCRRLFGNMLCPPGEDENQVAKFHSTGPPVLNVKTVYEMKLKTLNSCLLMVGISVSSHGALSFTNNFTAGSSPNMTLGTPFNASATPGYTTTAATNFTGAFNITSGPGARIYPGTNDTDYSSVDFSFEADVFVPNTTNPWSIIFLGMGSPDAPSSVPATTNTVSIFARPDNSQLEFLTTQFSRSQKLVLL